MDSEKHWNAFGLKFPGKHDAFRSAPAHPINNDARALLLFRRQVSIVVGVQQAQDRGICFLSSAILKYLHVHNGGIVVAKSRRKLNRAVTESSCLMNPPTNPMTMTGSEALGLPEAGGSVGPSC